MWTKEVLATYIDAGAARKKADLAILGGTLINVNTGEYYQANVAVYKGKIVAVDKDISVYMDEDTKIVDATGRYIAPGLIDCHIHVECSKMSMTRFAQAVVPHGTTSIVSGLDEYISVLGVDGLDPIFQEIYRSPLKVFWGLPYKTPYTIPVSTVAYTVTAKDHDKYQKDARCYGVWELVREAVQTKDEETLEALVIAKKHKKSIFGCSPLARGRELNEYLMSGVRVDHESYDYEEFLEKARKGIYTIIRESAVTKFLQENIRAITEEAPGVARHTCFCTDDVHARGILQYGHIDHLVRLAIKAGVAPMTAIQMATINAAEAYRIDDQVGSVTPGKDADIIIVDQPGNFYVQTVISKGNLVVEEKNEKIKYVVPNRSEELVHTVRHTWVKDTDFAYSVSCNSGKARVATIQSIGPFMRRRKEVDVTVVDGIIQADIKQDVAMVSVIERYGKNGNISKGFISGWSLQKGAVATTAAPDDNNLVVVGVNCKDMAMAANWLIEKGGGQVVVADGKILAWLPLPLAGIVSDLEPKILAQREQEIEEAIKKIGCTLPEPMFYISFLPITAIPDLAITDGGNVDYTKLSYFDPILSVQEEK